MDEVTNYKIRAIGVKIKDPIRCSQIIRPPEYVETEEEKIRRKVLSILKKRKKIRNHILFGLIFTFGVVPVILFILYYLMVLISQYQCSSLGILVGVLGGFMFVTAWILLKKAFPTEYLTIKNYESTKVFAKYSERKD
jgi:uncharacterized membrane protein